MSKRVLINVLAVWCVVATCLVPVAAQAQLCAPLDNGRMATPFYEGTAIFWEPEIEYRKMVLTISGPCEEIVKTFGPNDTISFDIREIERITDGTYRWQLSRESRIDEGVQEELQASRGSGEEDAVYWNFFQKGLIPAGPYFDSGSFTVVQGEIVDPNSGEEKRAEVATKGSSGAAGASVAAGFSAAPSAQGATGGGGGNSLATKDFVIIDDLIVDGSACIGFDCVNGESFGFDTIRLKENNLRIKFDDTSTAASFPRNDWQITANDSANGGASKFSIDDISGSRTPFTIEANAPSHSLYVDDGGRVGFGTSTPSVELHSIDGDTPALRLQQDGSSGFAPQTWDIAGNETNFFVRDVTNGSTLPFRIRPGAPSSAIFIDVGGDVGIGTSSPGSQLHVRNSDGSAAITVEETNGTASDRNLLTLENNGPPTLLFDNGNAASNGTWTYTVTNGGVFQVNASGSGVPIELQLSEGGDMTIGGMLTENSSRTVKTGFEELDANDVLGRLVEMPVTAWSYRHDEEGTRHIGPMAEDFFAAFGVGLDDKHIAPSDKAGVAMVAIQGLHDMVRERDQRIEELSRSKEELEERLAALEALVAETLSD